MVRSFQTTGHVMITLMKMMPVHWNLLIPILKKLEKQITTKNYHRLTGMQSTLAKTENLFTPIVRYGLHYCQRILKQSEMPISLRAVYIILRYVNIRKP